QCPLAARMAIATPAVVVTAAISAGTQRCVELRLEELLDQVPHQASQMLLQGIGDRPRRSSRVRGLTRARAPSDSLIHAVLLRVACRRPSVIGESPGGYGIFFFNQIRDTTGETNNNHRDAEAQRS